MVGIGWGYRSTLQKQKEQISGFKGVGIQTNMIINKWIEQVKNMMHHQLKFKCEFALHSLKRTKFQTAELTAFVHPLQNLNNMHNYHRNHMIIHSTYSHSTFRPFISKNNLNYLVDRLLKSNIIRNWRRGYMLVVNGIRYSISTYEHKSTFNEFRPKWKKRQQFTWQYPLYWCFPLRIIKQTKWVIRQQAHLTS